MIGPQDVLRFWRDELSERDWYAGGAALDARIAAGFADAVAAARAGGLTDWQTGPDGALAYLILTDQMSRNIHRDTALAFAADPLAHAAAYRAVALNWDMQIDGAARQFFYMPFMHAETMADQNRSVACFAKRMADSDNLLHARAHRQVIRRYGRFPTRNAALGRAGTAGEQAYLDQGGNGALVRALKQG